jgi:hypothetical protein
MSYCTAQNQQKPVASIKQAPYNEAHDDWMVLVRVDFTLPFNEGVDGSSPSSLNFKKTPSLQLGFFLKLRLEEPLNVAPYGLEVSA